MELIEWLENRFPAAQYGRWNNGDLTHAMFVEFGVNVQIEGCFYQMKYEMTVLTDWSAVCQQCRGIIVMRRHTWTIASLPFFKFFNQNEMECPLRDAKKFASMADEVTFVEKADGTGIQLWYCGDEALEYSLELMRSEQGADGTIAHRKDRDNEVHAQILTKLREGNTVNRPGAEALLTPDERRTLLYHRNKKTGLSEGIRIPMLCKGWRISTFGRITPADLFENLFWNILGERSMLALDQLDREVTYLFELCGAENKVVTEYPNDRLYVIGGRHRKNLSPFQAGWSAGSQDIVPHHALDAVCKSFANPLILRPLSVSAPVKTLAEAVAFVEEQSRRLDLGKTPEGFVLCLSSIPLAKMKNQNYLNRHGLMTGPLLYCRGIVIERFFAGTLDDVDDCLSEPLRLFVEELKSKVKSITHEVWDLWNAKLKPALLGQAQLTGAVISHNVTTLIPVKYAPFFYRSSRDLIKDDAGFDALFLEWLKGNYHLKGLVKFWKETQIPQFVYEERLMGGELRLKMAEDDTKSV